MKKIIMLIFFLALITNAHAITVFGVNLQDKIILNNTELKLNGYGIRKKWFIKVYIGALYSAKKITSFQEATKGNFDKVIRIHFLHNVDKNKVIDSIIEAFNNVSPYLVTSDEGRRFFLQFDKSFKTNDVLDIVLLNDGTIITKHNENVLGHIKSSSLAYGLLSIYIGDKPIDDELKKGMLGVK